MIVKLLKPLLSDEKFETCISMSLFKNKYSENFQKYRNRLAIFLPKIPKKAYVRLYVDDSVFEDEEFKKIFNTDHSNIEYYWYQDKRFLLEDGIHHDGTFGSIIRILPLFDTSLEVDYVWISDIDIYPRDLNYKYIENMKKNNIKVSYMSSKCYNKKWIIKDLDYPIILFRLIIKKKDIDFKKSSFNTFLRDVSNNKYKYIKEEIESNEFLIKKKEMYSINKFIYGFDELYVNNFMFETLNQYKRLVYIHLTFWNLRFKFDIDFQKMFEYEQTFFMNKTEDNLVNIKKEFLRLKPFIYKNITEKYPFDSKIKKCIDFYYDNIDKLNLQDPMVINLIV